MLTLTGMVVIPVCLAALAGGLRAQLAVLAMGAMLSSAAVVNLGSFGVQPGYFMALLLLGQAGAFALLRGGYALDRTVLMRLLPVAVLLLASLNALFWANAVFWDEVWVVSGRQLFDLTAAERYSFRAENLNQLSYLMLNAALALLLANRLTRLPPGVLLRTAHTAVRAAFGLATVFVAWDWLAHQFGFYVPDAFLHSNAFYAAAHNQSFGAIHRVSGPFSEPSSLAYAYGGFLFYASGCYLADRRARSLLLVLVALTALCISTSTTAYALLALWAAGMALAVPLTARRAGHRPRPGAQRAAVAALAVLAVAGAVAFTRTHGDDIRVIYEESIAGKTETGSFASRTGADRMGLDTLSTTWGLGLGLGSHRPSTLPVTLLSNVGLPGTVAFALFVGLCLHRPRRYGRWPGEPGALWPFRALTLGLLLAHCISSPNLNSLLLWLSLALNLGIAAHRMGEIADTAPASRRGVVQRRTVSQAAPGI